MLLFFITTEERRRAQDRAATFDISKSNPPGTYPYVWDNRQNSVKRWYDYGSPADKVGTVYFEVVTPTNNKPFRVKCTTEIAYRVLGESEAWHVSVDDAAEHQRLLEFFLRDLLTRPSNHVKNQNPIDASSPRP